MSRYSISESILIGSYQKVIIVTDKNVARLHLKELEESFFSKKLRIEKINGDTNWQ